MNSKILKPTKISQRVEENHFRIFKSFLCCFTPGLLEVKTLTFLKAFKRFSAAALSSLDWAFTSPFINAAFLRFFSLLAKYEACLFFFILRSRFLSVLVI